MKKELIERNDILGDWISDNKESKIQIYENTDSGCIHGKVTWIIEDESNPDGPVLDGKNPDKGLRQRPISGLDIITGLLFNAQKKEWKRGQIYNPEEGKIYNLKAWFLDDKDTLNLRPSIDAMGLMGTNLKWHRHS